MTPIDLVGTGLAVAFTTGLLGALAALVVPRRLRPAATGSAVAVSGAAATVAGVAAMGGQVWALSLPWLVPLVGVELAVDRLGGLFVAVGGAVAVAVGVYAISYARNGLDGRPVQAVFPLFVLSLLLVPAAGSVGTLLLSWELMALTSLLLVLAEHGRRAEVAAAGRWYAVMTHIGFVAIMIGLLVLAVPAADGTFTAVRAAAAMLPPATAGLVFVLCLLGFGSKAGILPLHAWLPRAHPEAPSHVSALMSAAMVNLGVYGIVRVGMDLLGGGPAWWWLLALGVGAASAVYGILQAAVGSDVKRLLGHSTTENMGLVLVGVGASGLFAATGNTVLAGLALTAALLHLAAHAAFKTLLFLAAGSVVHATGTRDLDRLGGLRTAMPFTTAAFGAGALAASALPPGPAFVSEWLLLQALVHGLPAPSVTASMVLPLAVAAVALTAGLAVATFVKAFGVGFLARPRSADAAGAHESPPSMLAGMAVAGLACAGLAVAPTAVLPAVSAVAGAVTGAGPAVTGTVTVELLGVAGAISPLLLVVAIAGAALLVVTLVTAVPRLLATKRAEREVRLWDCGAGPMSARMEYTATSFAEPLQRVFDDVLDPVSGVDVTHVGESRYLVTAVAYRRSVPDRVERAVYAPVLAAVAAWGRAGRRLAGGSVHRYLGYGFATLCVVLVLLVVTR